MPQIISKDNVIYCQTTVDYPANIVKDMKSAGYKVKTMDKLPTESIVKVKD